jgi:hypothetical protein
LRAGGVSWDPTLSAEKSGKTGARGFFARKGGEPRHRAEGLDMGREESGVRERGTGNFMGLGIIDRGDGCARSSNFPDLSFPI